MALSYPINLPLGASNRLAAYIEYGWRVRKAKIQPPRSTAATQNGRRVSRDEQRLCCGWHKSTAAVAAAAAMAERVMYKLHSNSYRWSRGDVRFTYKHATAA